VISDGRVFDLTAESEEDAYTWGDIYTVSGKKRPRYSRLNFHTFSHCFV